MSNSDYFKQVRWDIADLLPDTATRILEIGCAEGGTLGWAKGLYPGSFTVGIDRHEPYRASMAGFADGAIIADLDTGLPIDGRFDLVLALDVLEHLQNCEEVLASLVRDHLAPGGAVIVSLPAVSHFSVVLPLLLARRFRYVDQGVLDRTHRWFFVEETCVELMNRAGLKVRHGLLGGIQTGKRKLANLLTLGLLRHWLTEQYIMLGRVETAPQRRVSWKVIRYEDPRPKQAE